MITVKGFGVIPTLAANASGVTSTIGELSARANTFSKDIKIYNKLAIGDEVSLHAFSIASDTMAGPSLSTQVAEDALSILNKLYTVMSTSGTTVRTSTYIINELETFDSTDIFKDFEIGDQLLVSYPPRSIEMHMPSWMSFSKSDDSVTFKIWFSNSHFESQYDVREMFVIPPVANISSFNTTNKTIVETAIAGYPAISAINAIKAYNDEAPITEILTEHFEWVSTADPTQTVDTMWTVVVRGGMPSADDVKGAIVSYMNDNIAGGSTVLRAAIPTLFTDSLYIITPHWNKLSIPNADVASSMYSPVSGYADISTYAMITKDTVGEFTTNPTVAQYIADNAQLSYFPYKGLSFTFVGSKLNLANKRKLKDLFSDYMPIQSTSTDFSRLSDNTQSFLLLMASMVMYAEALDVGTDLPNTLKRKTYNGIDYVEGSLNGSTYLMASKKSILSLV